MPPIVLRVALPLPRPGLFDYLPSVPSDLSDAMGVRVRVPFGSRHRVGVVVEVGRAESEPTRLRPIIERVDSVSLLDGEWLASIRRAALYYHAPLGEFLATALPSGLRKGDPLPPTPRLLWQLTEAGRTAYPHFQRSGKPRLLADLLSNGPLREAALADRMPQWRLAARSLQARGMIENVVGSADAGTPLAASEPSLHHDQRVAAQAIIGALGSFRPMLLEGVTGSGKTEVYMTAIRECLQRGLQALVLVPEIGLTPQMLRRFGQRLGVAVHSLHSGLADGERTRVWAAMWRGEAQVLIGTRSAVFSPLPRAGLIVVDEEHDASYKQQDGVHYNARDLAVLRGQALDVPVVLGSATPALESLAAARAGRYQHLRLTQRAGGAVAPTVRVVDIRRQQLQSGLSIELLAAIGECLGRGEQALIFRNRRGYAPVLLCHDCGWSAQCPHCDAAMTVHARGLRLVCHHCGSKSPAPKACPECASLALQPQGVGTERLEEALAAAFPGVPCLRVDRETTRRRGALEDLLKQLGEGPGILVGTQMLAKGHDLPQLTLVGVVGVDEGLHSADFRAGERLAQLLIQVSGRAGRGSRAGTVLLQTHHPQHPLLLTLMGGGYSAFAAVELGERESAGFPPYAYFALLRAEANNEESVTEFLRAARTAMAAGATAKGIHVNGPLAAPMPRRAGWVRWQLLLSAPRRPLLHALLSEWMPRLYALRSARKVRWSLDVDPLDLY
ncbi:MAG: primosomal protein N' [Pseudomarimonas sp.]